MEQQAEKKAAASAQAVPIGIPKIPTQIEGLDDILHGGIPAQRTTLISGGPGTGKSVLGLESLYRRALGGNPGIFLSFEETGESIRQNAMSLGWDLSALEQLGNLFLMEAQVEPHVILSGAFNLMGLLAIIEGKAKEMDADMIVIDALDILMRFFDDPKQQQNEVFALHQWLKDQRMTAVLTAKNSKDTNMAYQYSYLDFMADCVLYLDHRVSEQVTTKRLQVIKYRGSGYEGNEYPFLISDAGIHLSPVSDIEMHYESGSQRISSGNKSLDAILGGGYLIGSCILISGVTGTGKTSIACTFARSACDEGQKVLYINYEEPSDGMVAGMLSLGIDLRPAINSSTLRVMSVMPESMGIEEHLFHILTAINHFQPRHVVMDAISASSRIAGEKAAFDFLIRLIDFCKHKGITVFLINQATDPHGYQEISGIGISSIIDTILTPGFRDSGNELSRILLVRKSRATKHSTKYHDFFLTDQGIQIDEGSL
ncbi:MAG: circadian clock protein KaiC [Thermodesulfobacteriota bacterium]